MQYKFRGKRKDNGEWVYGDLSNEYDGARFISYWTSECTDVSVNLWEPVQKSHEVVPETVGMWTGLKDKNGKETSEGDIYIAERGYMPSRGYKKKGYPEKITIICVVEWSVYDAGWYGREVSPIQEHIIYSKNAPYDYLFTSLHGSSDGNAEWIEVIGNIHDHPHLLTPAKGAVTNTMNNLDPNNAQAAPASEPTTEQVQAVEQEAQEQAMESADTETVTTAESIEETGG